MYALILKGVRGRRRKVFVERSEFGLHSLQVTPSGSYSGALTGLYTKACLFVVLYIVLIMNYEKKTHSTVKIQ